MNRGGITIAYRELVHMMQRKSGFSNTEAERALDLMVESLTERLTDDGRESLASQLPPELQDIALGAHVASHHERTQDIIREFMAKQGIEEVRAKKQIICAWDTLRSLISDRQVRQIKAQLPGHIAAILY